MKLSLFKFLKKRVSSFGIKDNYLYIVDELNRVFIFDSSLVFFRGFKLNFMQNNPKENSTKFSPDLKYLAITFKNITTIWDIDNKKYIAKFIEKYDVLSVGFDKNERYLAIGNLNGEINLYNIKINKKVSLVTKHKDFITDIDFYEDYEIVAGGYDKAVLFVNLIDFEKKERFSHIKNVKKVKVGESIISADAISDIVKWDIIKYSKKDRIDFYKEFRDFFVYKDILIILTSQNIILYDLKNEVILNDNFLEIKDGDKLVVFDNYLVVSDVNGMLFKCDLFEKEKEIIELLLKEDFKNIFNILDKNPFLKYSKVYERVEKFIDLKIKKAKVLFETNPQKAIIYIQNLLEVPNLREKIKDVIENYKRLIQFKKAIEEGNYILAYELVRLYPMLKDTKYYKFLEKKFELAFEKALKLIKAGRISDAKELLLPFYGINEKKDLIDLIIKKSSLIFLLREKLAKRDFKGFFALIKMHPELKNSKEYEKVMKYAENLYKKAKEFLENEEFEKAKKIATLLIEFDGYEDKAIKLLKKIEISLKFLAYLNEKNYEKAYELILLYPFLKKLKEYKEFMREWSNRMYNAEILLNEGKKEEALQMLKDFQNRYHLKRVNKTLKTI